MKFVLKKISEICSVKGGGTPSTIIDEYWNGDIPWLVPKELTNLKSRFISKTDKSITEKGLANSSAQLIPSGSLLLTSRATVGNVAVNTVPMATNQGFINIVCNENVDRDYFYYWLKQNKEILISNAHGTTFLELIKSVFKDLEIRIHEYVLDQQKIASILSAYDDLIENNTRRIQILEQMAQTIYKEWFVNFRFPGYENAKFGDSPLGKIPQGWEVNTVENTFDTLGGGTPSKVKLEYWDNGHINWFTPSDLTASKSMFVEGSQSLITEKGLNNSSAKIFPPYSVMMTSRATLGVISINTTVACTNQGFITCIPSGNIPLYILYFWLKNNVEKFISLGSGATFKEITKGVFRKIDLIVPSKNIVEKFELYINPICQQIENLLEKNLNLHRTRDLLLPKLMSGEVEV